MAIFILYGYINQDLPNRVEFRFARRFYDLEVIKVLLIRIANSEMVPICQKRTDILAEFGDKPSM